MAGEVTIEELIWDAEAIVRRMEKQVGKLIQFADTIAAVEHIIPERKEISECENKQDV